MTNNPPAPGTRKRKLHVYGSRCPWAKLNEQQVFDIREKYARGASRVALATEYKVDRKTIWEIVNWRTWAWMAEPEYAVEREEVTL